ncbi:MAG: tetratricopeptide repeat protein, partial [Endomicrobiia bacterium]
ASVTKSIYGDNYYKIWGEARLKIRSSVEKSIIEKTKNKVFYNTVLPLQTETKKYKFGLLYSTLEPAIVLPHEIFVIRNEPTKFVARAYSLYIVYLNLLAEYFLEVSKKYENMIDIAKKYYKKLFFISGESRYLGYIPYHYFSKNDYKKASEEYLKILNYPNIDEEDKIKFKLNLGVVYEYMGEYEKAQKCYYEILNIKSDFPEVYLNLGSLCWKIKKKDESIKWFSQYLKYKPYDEQIKKFVEHLQAK